MKRLFDIVLASIALVIFSPAIAVISIVVRYGIGSPILFHQMRPGLNGKLFRMYKFRTMNNARGSDGELLPDENRLTSIGKFLRLTSLDELPGLWNVLKGDMSVVGPRPLLPEYLPLYSESQARRHEVRPGLTGWAQVNGRNTLSWEKRFEYDVWYVDNRSATLDLKILLMTILKVLKRSDVNPTDGKAMEKFRGSR